MTKGLHNTGTEMSLQVLAYNMKRVINLMGVEGLVRALHALFSASNLVCMVRLQRHRLNHEPIKPVTGNLSSDAANADPLSTS